MPKITVIGSGNVGATAAINIAQKGLGDVVMIDIIEGIPQGKALDIQQSMPLWGSPSRVTGSNDFSSMSGSDIVVVTAGVPRKPGMTREDLLEVNAKIIRSVCAHIKEHAPDSIVIIVTNPLDSMTWLAFKELGFPRERVMGMAGVLDSTRLRTLLSLELDVNPRDVETMVMGSHGDTMVSVLEQTRVKGRPVKELIPRERLDEIVEKTRNGGAEIVSHLKTGSAFYAPGASITEMVEAMLKDSGKVLPVSAYLEGEYGHSGIFLGVPARLGRKGMQEVLSLELGEDDRKALDESARAIAKAIETLKSTQGMQD